MSWFTETSCESYNSLSFEQICSMVNESSLVICFFNNIIVMIYEGLVNLIHNEYCIRPLIFFDLWDLVKLNEYYSFCSASLRREFNWYKLLTMLLEEVILQIGSLSCNINHCIRHLVIDSLSDSIYQDWFSMSSRHFDKNIAVMFEE